MILSVVKLLAGIIARSGAMISDAVHSASDVFSTFVVIIGIKFASKKPDKEHPYGHERMECVAAIILAVVLFITGLGIGIDALRKILSGNYSELQIPGVLALIAAIVSIVSKEAMEKMVDHSCDEETEKQIHDCIMKNENVKGIDLLQTRIFGNKIYVDVEIQAEVSYTLQEAHDIAEVVHDEIEQSFPKVKHIMVHVNPASEENE